jgi:hypothetical protein
MTPKGQWNSSLPIQWCLLDPYGRVRVVDSSLLCPLGCQWTQKFCWLLGSITDFQPKFCWKSTLHDTTGPMKLFIAQTLCCRSNPKNGTRFFVSRTHNTTNTFNQPLYLGLPKPCLASEHHCPLTQIDPYILMQQRDAFRLFCLHAKWNLCHPTLSSGGTPWTVEP